MSIRAVTARRRNGWSIDKRALPVARAACRFAGTKADPSTTTAAVRRSEASLGRRALITE